MDTNHVCVTFYLTDIQMDSTQITYKPGGSYGALGGATNIRATAEESEVNKSKD